MYKIKKYTITILVKGYIVQELHYGIHARNWWEPYQHSQTNVKSIPYRLFMSVNCCLNNKNFAITVLNNKETHKPGFRCLCDGIDSGIQPSSTAAINNTYNTIYSIKT